ncbi:hypothetical protein OHU11_02985 [Streptomyces sp. NBC_00257]|uniref:hypothetical protein n=1 Tax=Streptomyces TaxID=1883 RepID=UPI00224CFD94|nr:MULTISPECIES: hypothetical protein [unclassified Streptomyces]WSW10901.1 hypothetical protein OG298_03895 [Streptomyces sp. NBC_01005]WTD00406.1 hypothetical protein OH736_03890 [Streptomyces sp. NBC_01650]WTH88070.1 hypothetical protein OIC43_02810 [Streptomyces sp. NBC_00825]WTH96797.1 hypothetical protein OHA23_02810 [Streptomyces sp. NBC_00822]MCX4870288.1 hypothetical protein [Streptomyces sp. NBC_00906]
MAGKEFDRPVREKEFGAYEEFARAFPAGCTQVRPLPTNWARLLEPYLLFRDVFILDSVTTAAPVNADVASWGPRRIARIVAPARRVGRHTAHPGPARPRLPRAT